MFFRFQKASCVVVGTFNIHILHPQWLVSRGIIEKDLEVGIESNLTRPGLRLRFPQQGALWSITPDRLVIETQDAALDCGGTIARVLGILRETPLFAIGNNLHCTAEFPGADALPERLRQLYQVDSVPPPLKVAQRTFHLAVERAENELINLQVAVKGDEIELLGNVHYGLAGVEDPNGAAVVAAERFFADRAAAELLANQALGVSISHDGNHA